MDNSRSPVTRTCTIREQTCLVHIPEQPNGFLVLYLGDVGHYVEEHQSAWSEHPSKATLLQALLEEGYTLFTSHLYGNGWGSSQSIDLLHHVYQLVKRQEIVNPHIHVIAEGMGALTALKWHEQEQLPIRSFILFTPCVDLQALYEQERSNQLFFKRFTKQLAMAYSVAESDVESQVITNARIPECRAPMLIYHDLADPYLNVQEHGRKLEQNQQRHASVQLKLTVQPVIPRVTKQLLTFMKRYETSLEQPF
ncbi:hypothetical protein [Pontibacillus litoralis]|uniref:Hydrolase n=1 Tax=Pontibacillus litoralis JSM 072002 TaxID=1385512 RepID=A0A0A5G9E5_9BACI|nr:hypothetical protein [Pontibacillus litoralis]KGX87735.1 hydrolase [Pontibacillus litoralis JSM 072002]